MDGLLRRQNFQKIIQFYLFECPVIDKKGKRVSSRGRSFKERRLEGNGLTSLCAAMKRCSAATINTVNQLSVAPHGANEYLIVRERSDMSNVNAYFYAIRNALAHGSFNVDNGVYEIENWHNGQLKAIGRIREKTLLRWIELCDLRVSDLKEAR